jgi:undecaprenyl pyrophosphate phosphatase UppP
VVIKLPIDVLVVAFDNNPNNYDDEIKVKYKRKFAEGFAQLVNELPSNSESGLTVFQEWIDQIFEEMIEGDVPYVKYPKEDY